MVTDTIQARVAGHDLRFRLPRGGHLTVLEQLLGTTASGMLARLQAGEWRQRDVAALLTFSAVPTRETGPIHLERTIEAAVERRPALFAALASLTLVAGLMGVDPVDALFSDEEDGE